MCELIWKAISESPNFVMLSSKSLCANLCERCLCLSMILLTAYLLLKRFPISWYKLPKLAATETHIHPMKTLNFSELVGASLVAQLEERATHSRTLAWKISWTEEPGGLQSMGSQRVGHD